MSKTNKKKSSNINSKKNEYIFNNVILNMNISLIDFCYKIKEIAGDNQILINTPDYYFANAILDWENKKYENHRIFLLLLLQYIDVPVPIYITLILQKKHKFSLTERTTFFNSIDLDKEFVHEYYLLINTFINTTKGSKTAYISSFLKLLSNKQGEYNLKDDTLLYFYEYFHAILVNQKLCIILMSLFVKEKIVGSLRVPIF